MGILTSSSVAGSTRPKQRQEHVRLLQDQTSLLTAALLHDLRGQHKNGGEGGLRVSSHDPRSSDETMRRSVSKTEETAIDEWTGLSHASKLTS